MVRLIDILQQEWLSFLRKHLQWKILDYFWKLQEAFRGTCPSLHHYRFCFAPTLKKLEFS